MNKATYSYIVRDLSGTRAEVIDHAEAEQRLAKLAAEYASNEVDTELVYMYGYGGVMMDVYDGKITPSIGELKPDLQIIQLLKLTDEDGNAVSNEESISEQPVVTLDNLEEIYELDVIYAILRSKPDKHQPVAKLIRRIEVANKFKALFFGTAGMLALLVFSYKTGFLGDLSFFILGMMIFAFFAVFYAKKDKSMILAHPKFRQYVLDNDGFGMKKRKFR